jgi:hypothetical protein
MEKNEIGSNIFLKKEVKFINRNVAVFVFFLVLSFILWYLNSLGKETEADIRYPVSYINLPKGRIIVEEQPVKLNLSLKGPGYSILKHKLTASRKPVIIDISSVSYKRVPGSKNLNYYIVTSGISKNLIVQLKSECEITLIKPDTLFFTLGKEAADPTLVKPDNKVVKDGK